MTERVERFAVRNFTPVDHCQGHLYEAFAVAVWFDRFDHDLGCDSTDATAVDKTVRSILAVWLKFYTYALLCSPVTAELITFDKGIQGRPEIPSMADVVDALRNRWIAFHKSRTTSRCPCFMDSFAPLFHIPFPAEWRDRALDPSKSVDDVGMLSTVCKSLHAELSTEESDALANEELERTTSERTASVLEFDTLKTWIPWRAKRNVVIRCSKNNTYETLLPFPTEEAVLEAAETLIGAPQLGDSSETSRIILDLLDGIKGKRDGTDLVSLKRCNLNKFSSPTVITCGRRARSNIIQKA